MPVSMPMSMSMSVCQCQCHCHGLPPPAPEGARAGAESEKPHFGGGTMAVWGRRYCRLHGRGSKRGWIADPWTLSASPSLSSI